MPDNSGQPEVRGAHVPWYAVRCKPHQERSASLHLTRAGVGTFLPEIREFKSVRGITQSCVAPLFPGYLFAQFSFDRDYRTVAYCRGVRGLVSFGNRPAVVEVDLLNAIRDRIVDGYVALQEPPQFVPGQLVRIQGGPLRGLEAVFERTIPDYQRAVLLLRALSFQAKLIVELRDIVNL